MSLIKLKMKQYTNMEQNAPQNETKPSIKLLNGTTLECYPRTGEAPRRTYGPVLESPTFFAKNAYYLLDHADVIMSDSRMFLSSVPVTNGAAPGSFAPPCIGAYLEWWMIVFPQATVDTKGNDALTYRVSGSGLSGRNFCGIVNRDGKISSEQKPYFSAYWGISTLSSHYCEASHKYETYTLEQVIDLLHEYDAKVSDPQERRVKVLEQEVTRMRNLFRTMQEDHNEELRMVLSLFDDRLRSIKNAHKSQKREVDAQTAELQRQRRNFKQQYKEGLITQQEYQGKVKGISSQRTDYERELKDIREKPLRELVKDNLKLYNIFSKYMEEL